LDSNIINTLHIEKLNCLEDSSIIFNKIDLSNFSINMEEKQNIYNFMAYQFSRIKELFNYFL